MSGICKAEQVELEQLETAAAALANALECGALLALRLRQIGRRAPELRRLVEYAQSNVGELVDYCDGAHENLKGVITSRQQARTAAQAQ